MEEFKSKMTDSVSYKAYLRSPADSDSGAAPEPEIRRFLVDKDVSTSLQYLKSKIGELFPRIRNDVFDITWVDSDGDRVILGSDEELIIALTEMNGPVYKLDINVKPKMSFNDGEKKPSSAVGEPHPGVVCDSCEAEPILGFRYKCVVCPDYDLCGDCEAKGRHPGHSMMRIATPEDAWPSHLLRRLNKAHDRIHKRASERAERAASASHAEAHRERCEAASEAFANGGWVHGFGGPRPRGFGCGNGMRGRSRGPAFGGPGGHKQVWDAMMKGWSAQGGCQEQQQQQQSTQQEKKEETRDKAAKAAEGRTQGNNGSQNQSPKSPMAGIEDLIRSFVGGTSAAANGNDYLKDVGNLVAAALDPLGVDVQVDIEHNGRRSTVGQPEKAEEATEEKKEEEEVKEKVEPEKEKPKEEEEEVNAPSPTPSSEPDDDWTVVPKKDEKKNESISIPVTVTTTTTSMTSAEGFEIPIHVSDKPAKVLFADVDGTLYPELPEREESPAVSKEEKEEEEEEEAPLLVQAQAEAAISGAPSAPEPVVITEKKEEEKKPTGPPKAVHSDPKIQVALQAMLNMGFTNDGGWLTQLLESKEGDIGKALDVLQPVRPNRR